MLASLSVANNGIEEFGALQFATAILKGLSALTNLNLAMNKVGDRGAVALAGALLQKPGNLASLNLRNNFIGDNAAVEFAGLLVRRQVLNNLDLSCNRWQSVDQWPSGKQFSSLSQVSQQPFRN
eukprot:SAG31_NODE_4287_length_3378_cov_4.554132_3_plen_124_part_00